MKIESRIKPLSVIALVLFVALLQGCLLNSLFSGDSRLQLENGSRSTIADLEVVGSAGTVRLLLGDTLSPGERTRTRAIDLNGLFRLHITVGDTACFVSGCGKTVDLGVVELGGSRRYRFISDRDGSYLEER